MDQHSCDVNYPAESAHLEKSLLEKYRRNEEQRNASNAPDIKKFPWIACADFTTEEGKKQIGSYIQTWELQSRWLYSLDFLYSSEQEFRTFHHYRARFSSPKSWKPILGTASVYFSVDLSKVKPQNLPVQVHFVLESNRLIHTAGRTKFQDKWLDDVIESKTLLRRAVNL